MNKFYKLLFEPYEGVCWAKEPYGTTVSNMDYMGYPEENFFAINPLHLTKDLERPDSGTGRRADCNVSCFRNILIEIDSMPVSEQMKYIGDLHMPHSTCVYSGGKSMHFIISLSEPCVDIEDYRELVYRVLAKVPAADKTTKNPSRLSRAPGAMRGNYCQNLQYVRSRVSRAELETWLGPAPYKAPESYYDQVQATGLKPTFSIFTKYFLRYGAEPGKWNAALFNATCDMVRCNLTEPEISIRLEAITGRLTRADRKTIKSAVQRASRDVRVLSTT